MDEGAQGAGRVGSGMSIAKVERLYLAALRVMSLLLATGLIAWAAWLAVTGLYGMARDASAVTERPVVVTAEEVAALPADKGGEQSSGAAPGDPLRSEKAFYKDFANRYFTLYDTRYQTFRKADELRLSRAAFEERFIGTPRRLAAISDGDLDFREDRERLERLLAVMGQVAALPGTTERLQRYRRAVKTRTSRVVAGTRSERYCSYYGYYIDECITYATREVPYRRTVTEARLPTGVLAPADLFGRHQDHFLSLLALRTEQNANAAKEERDRIVEGNIAGSAKLGTAVRLAGGFLIVMFLFLLIAIERHQRRLAAGIAPSA